MNTKDSSSPMTLPITLITYSSFTTRGWYRNEFDSEGIKALLRKNDDYNFYFITFRSRVVIIFKSLFNIISSQEQYDPDDPANPCTNYPTEEFSSYADCDDHFVKRSLPPGLKPFWAVDNISEATNRYSMSSKRRSYPIGKSR